MIQGQNLAQKWCSVTGVYSKQTMRSWSISEQGPKRRSKVSWSMIKTCAAILRTEQHKHGNHCCARSETFVQYLTVLACRDCGCSRGSGQQGKLAEKVSWTIRAGLLFS
jgi:hypothetical protein